MPRLQTILLLLTLPGCATPTVAGHIAGPGFVARVPPGFSRNKVLLEEFTSSEPRLAATGYVRLAQQHGRLLLLKHGGQRTTYWSLISVMRANTTAKPFSDADLANEVSRENKWIVQLARLEGVLLLYGRELTKFWHFRMWFVPHAYANADRISTPAGIVTRLSSTDEISGNRNIIMAALIRDGHFWIVTCDLDARVPNQEQQCRAFLESWHWT